MTTPAFHPQSRWQPHPQVMVQGLGDHTVLVHMETDRIFELNATAARLWALLGAGTPLGEAQAALLTEFSVTPEVLEAEIARTVQTLHEEGLLLPDAR